MKMDNEEINNISIDKDLHVRYYLINQKTYDINIT